MAKKPTTEGTFIKPRNWDEFQHYKGRRPPWIKLHKGLLDDYDFHCLPDASRALAPLLWLLASEFEDGRITSDFDKIAFRLHMRKQEFIEAIKPLIDTDFFETNSAALAACKQSAIPEVEAEVEAELESQVTLERGSIEKKKPAAKKSLKLTEPKEPTPPKLRPMRLPQNWTPSTKNNDDARQSGLTELELAAQVIKFRNYFAHKAGSDGTSNDWDARWHNWCLDAASKLGRAPNIPEVAAPKLLSYPHENWVRFAKIYRNTNNWISSWGPPPGDPNCQMPPDLLKEFLEGDDDAGAG